MNKKKKRWHEEVMRREQKNPEGDWKRKEGSPHDRRSKSNWK